VKREVVCFLVCVFVCCRSVSCIRNAKFNFRSAGLLAKPNEAAKTPLPYWICPCKASLWREFHDPQQVTTSIDMAVSLSYSKETFTEDMQTRFRTSVASVANVPVFRVIINTINETQTQVNETHARRLLTVAIDVYFSVRVSLEAPGTVPSLASFMGHHCQLGMLPVRPRTDIMLFLMQNRPNLSALL